MLINITIARRRDREREMSGESDVKKKKKEIQQECVYANTNAGGEYQRVRVLTTRPIHERDQSTNEIVKVIIPKKSGSIM